MADFNFAPDSHVAVEIPPEEPEVITMNGWDFTARPAVPYRRRFRLKMAGLYWRVSNGILDVTTVPSTNAGALLQFYQTHRRWKPFTYQHEYLGLLTCRFAEPVSIPEALQNSNGLVPEFEVVLVHHNPGY